MKKVNFTAIKSLNPPQVIMDVAEAIILITEDKIVDKPWKAFKQLYLSQL